MGFEASKLEGLLWLLSVWLASIASESLAQDIAERRLGVPIILLSISLRWVGQQQEFRIFPAKSHCVKGYFINS
ncbi:hypothetical protein AVDCRST_MAG92-3492 [uncultured Coleofasciculus sp.]|uniref:Uncharacterized protein n=1 Tax=uncultured Coleofasciculus sp. TaxID=1267456 RepID=A0A6J4JIQ8_9CYAN|nr:hypothetical protein AVDCRST_MAG92-3492 [uncultured Coleofasciculus sp.]